MQQMTFEYNGEWRGYGYGPEALGRNGYVKCRGLIFLKVKQGNAVRISPITSRGHEGRSFIEVPVEHIDVFIENLNHVKKEEM